MIINRNIYAPSGMLLCPAGTKYTPEARQLLAKHRIALTDADFTSASDQEQTAICISIDQAVAELADIFNVSVANGHIELEQIETRIIPVIKQAVAEPNLLRLFQSLQATHDYTYRHTISVGIISTLLGQWSGMEGTELDQLTLGATLHDIGKLKIAPAILNKPGKLTPEEYAIMKQHAQLGYELIQALPGLSEQIALAALEHHEREDGSGYPYGLKSADISRFGKITAIADVFHALTSFRIYREAEPFYYILRHMHEGKFGMFDPRLSTLFIGKIMDSLVGSTALLSDGNVCTIVMVHPDCPAWPLVKCGSEFIDLNEKRTVFIEFVLQ